MPYSCFPHRHTYRMLYSVPVVRKYHVQIGFALHPIECTKSPASMRLLSPEKAEKAKLGAILAGYFHHDLRRFVHLKPPQISPNVPEFLARSPAPPSHNGSSANDQTGVFGLDKLCRRTQVMHRSACRGIHASHEKRGQQGDAARLSCAG